MKIILHFGQSKTGTTALQISLGNASETLRSRKILYPREGFKYFAHHLLLALSGREDRFSPWRLAQLGGTEGAVKAARKAWEITCEEVQRSRPELLVLSSEYLLRGTDAAAKARLASMLSDLSGDITPVIYIRHPVDHYRASLQEWIKRNDRPYPPKDSGLKRAILDIEAAFGRPPELVLFDRGSLIQGDTVVDFTTRFLAPLASPEDVPTWTANVGLSAEALMLLDRIRTEKGWDKTALDGGEPFFDFLRQLDRQEVPDQSFSLLPEVAEAMLCTSTSYRWLAETGRLVIPGLDVNRITGQKPPEWMQTAHPTALFLHDPHRLKRLERAVTQYLAQDGRLVAPADQQTPRVRNLLLRFLLSKLSADKTGNAAASQRK